MTTDEIKALIAQTIEGQGDAVDVGGCLAKILTALAERPATLDVTYLPSASVTERTLENILEQIGVSQTEFDALMAGEYSFLREQNNLRQYIYTGNNLDEKGYNGYNSATFFDAQREKIIEFVYNYKSSTWSIMVSSS